MASFLTYTLYIFYFILVLTFYGTVNGKFSEQSPMILSTKRMEKMTHLHFYFHDTVSGKNPTAMRIAGPPNKFGSTFLMDDPLTEGPEPTSKLVGRSQGLYALTSQHDVALLMVLNFAFLEGMYNGSSLAILGHNAVSDKVREMPVVGGSGIFRYARGYALAETVWYNQTTMNAVVECNVSVVHF